MRLLVIVVKFLIKKVLFDKLKKYQILALIYFKQLIISILQSKHLFKSIKYFFTLNIIYNQ